MKTYHCVLCGEPGEVVSIEHCDGFDLLYIECLGDCPVLSSNVQVPTDYDDYEGYKYGD